jgi:ubiquinone/menaquinone biosynthesis C-methylase UbiE
VSNIIPKLLDYQEEILNRFYEINNVQDQVVLEVGGSTSLAVPYELERRGAKEIVTVSINKSFKTQKINERITAMQKNASNLEFADEYFDSIFSVATLEHITNLSAVLKELYRVLKPNGIMYFEGGPMWSSSVGSHYNFSIGDVNYHYNKNPILLDWEHLYSDAATIANRLKEQYSHEIIHKLLDDVYTNPHINRCFPSELLEIISNSSFKIIFTKLEIWRHNKTIPPEVKAEIVKRHINFVEDCDRLTVCLTK